MKAHLILLVLTAFVLGTFIGSRYQISQQTFKSEEIVAREIMVLERYKDLPTCKILSATKADWGRITTDDGVIVWRYNLDKNTLQKVVVDKNMTAAYEELKVDCPPNTIN
jgi:hypothetical protein